ncbi:MAG: hypothetical protein KBC44_03360 [Candidatus Pacebacteria bacterium]|nr:hypothetical protein [Candidatus Paceibacterota bacterium]
MQEPKTLEDVLLDASTHYERVCTNCGQVWWGLHCPHDGYQNPCPNCDKKPTSVQELEHNTVCGCNGTLDLDEAEQSIQQLINECLPPAIKMTSLGEYNDQMGWLRMGYNAALDEIQANLRKKGLIK